HRILMLLEEPLTLAQAKKARRLEFRSLGGAAHRGWRRVRAATSRRWAETPCPFRVTPAQPSVMTGAWQAPRSVASARPRSTRRIASLAQAPGAPDEGLDWSSLTNLGANGSYARRCILLAGTFRQAHAYGGQASELDEQQHAPIDGQT